jgi:L,D-transpeptidase catalytic domain
MERLTWGGVALHAGGIPGYPESHGCIHLPTEFARELFEISPRGMTVVIASTATEPTSVNHPGYLAPVGVAGGAPIERTPLAASEEDQWQPEASPSGPVSIVLSRQSQRIVVYRNGIEIGRARIAISGDQPLSTHALVLAAGPSPFADPYVPDATKYRWLRIGVPGHLGEAGGDPDPATIGRIKIPPDFVKEVASVLSPGATVLVTDHAILPSTTGPHLQLIDADPPTGPRESEHQS